jgi:hypothetical protein
MAKRRNNSPIFIDLPVGAGEQECIERTLQRFDLLAERRLRDAKTLGGAAEVQFLGQDHEIAQLPTLHSTIRVAYQSGRKSCWTLAPEPRTFSSPTLVQEAPDVWISP